MARHKGRCISNGPADSHRPILAVSGLRTHFFTREGTIKAVDGVDLSVRQGEILGLVGESGCGKTTIGRLLLQLLPPTAGEVRFDGTDITRLSRSRMRRLRHRMQIVFQDPYSSLDPRMTVGSTLITPMKIQRRYAGRRRERAVHLLERVGLKASDLERYPHEFSGTGAYPQTASFGPE